MVKKMRVQYVGGTTEDISYTKRVTLARAEEVVFTLPNGNRKSVNVKNVLSMEEL